MGVTVTWDDTAKTVIRYELEGLWSFAELEEAVHSSNALISEVKYCVHMIVYVRVGARVPRPEPGLMNYCKGLMEANKEKEGLVVVASNDDLIISMTKVFIKFFPRLGQRILVVRSLDIARSLLQKRIMSEMTPYKLKQNIALQ